MEIDKLMTLLMDLKEVQLELALLADKVAGMTKRVEAKYWQAIVDTKNEKRTS